MTRYQEVIPSRTGRTDPATTEPALFWILRQRGVGAPPCLNSFARGLSQETPIPPRPPYAKCRKEALVLLRDQCEALPPGPAPLSPTGRGTSKPDGGHLRSAQA